jgi:CBS domain-containing protein
MKSIKSIVADRPVVTAARSTSVVDAARVMAAQRIGALPVVDEGRLVGIFTERDLLVRIVAENRDPAATTIGDCMSSQLFVADVGESYDQCLHRMREAHVRHLIILDGERLAGILSLRDLMDVDLGEKAEAISLLTAYVRT